MGQGQSGQSGPRNVSTEQLSHELALRFARRCFTSLELYSFRDVFRSLADTTSDLQHWREDTLCRFLEIPDALGVGPVVYQSATYLGAFPFPSLAPSILGFEALLKVVVIMTERYRRVLKRGKTDRIRLLFRSLAVFDRKASDEEEKMRTPVAEEKRGTPAEEARESFQAAMREASKGVAGFAVDDAANDDEEDEDDDELALAALDALDAIEVFKHGEKSNIHQAQIPTDNFRRLLMLLIVAAPLTAQESLSTYAERFTGERLEGLKRTADNMLWAFGVEKHPGVLYHHFNSIIPVSMPYLFDGLNPLFEHFLFSKKINLSKRKDEPAALPTTTPDDAAMPPLLIQEGEILDVNLLSQLSFFLKGSRLFRQLRPLYSGSDSGFSMGSFETKVFNWRAPTILLVAGTRVTHPARTPREKSFADTLPPKKFRDGAKGNTTDARVVFGAYLETPWKHTHKECFGDTNTLLFQLSPIHEVFQASTINRDYISFNKPPTANSGISIGSPIPRSRTTTSSYSSSYAPTHTTLGPVSLFLDSALEFGVFTHDANGGGSFHTSNNPARRGENWQERFAIDSLEVWGLGGEDEERAQRERWEWEEREAERRRRVNLGRSGDVDADRALLEMAGLVGQNRSGGSMG
ncbi:MAG: Restriction of telomere capping protein 5 [Thelocarpon superellum]|nr:MAG: Restriction of telomere capping protein 5 [Thelocarpon superellum]